MRTRLISPGKMVVVCGSERPLVLTMKKGTANLTQEEIKELTPTSWSVCDDIDSPDQCSVYYLGLILNSLGAASLVLIIASIALGFLPVPHSIISQDTPILLSFCTVIVSSIMATCAHESLHVFFGNTTWQSVRRSGSILHTNLNHVLAWSKPSALSAIGAGPSIDYIIIIATLGLYYLTSSALFLSIAYINLVRCVWEFNIFQKRDLRLFLNILLDRPDGIIPINQKTQLFGMVFDTLLFTAFLLPSLTALIGR